MNGHFIAYIIIFFQNITIFLINQWPYCIPEKILKVAVNEYKYEVKMLNCVTAPFVPSDYVMKHWKHILDDYQKVD
jgi:hypothetical protein